MHEYDVAPFQISQCVQHGVLPARSAFYNVFDLLQSKISNQSLHIPQVVGGGCYYYCANQWRFIESYYRVRKKGRPPSGANNLSRPPIRRLSPAATMATPTLEIAPPGVLQW